MISQTVLKSRKHKGFSDPCAFGLSDHKLNMQKSEIVFPSFLVLEIAKEP